MHDVRIAERYMQNFKSHFFRLQRRQLEGIHDQLGVLIGEDPSNGICFFEGNLLIKWMVESLHSDKKMYSWN
jgi:hypothetical protein